MIRRPTNGDQRRLLDVSTALFALSNVPRFKEVAHYLCVEERERLVVELLGTRDDIEGNQLKGAIKTLDALRDLTDRDKAKAVLERIHKK